MAINTNHPLGLTSDGSHYTQIAPATVGGMASAGQLILLDSVSGLLAPSMMPAFTGDAITAAGATALTLAPSGVTAGSYGSSSVTPGTAPTMPYVTIDAKGRTTAVASVALGTAASYPVGTTGAVIPLLSSQNNWTGLQQFNSQLTWPATSQTSTSISIASTTKFSNHSSFVWVAIADALLVNVTEIL